MKIKQSCDQLVLVREKVEDANLVNMELNGLSSSWVMQEHLSIQSANQPRQSAHIQRMKGGAASFIFVLNVIKWFRLVSHRKPCLFRRCLGSAFMVDLAEI
jgi:hypothetical protein